MAVVGLEEAALEAEAVVAGKYENVHGLTGSIACGKTTVAKFFIEFGIPVIDLDNVSREVVKPNSEGLNKIIQVFGKEYLNENGTLNRKKLGALIFNNKKAKQKLEQILHPLIFEKEKEIVYKYKRPVIVDAALMIETGSYKRYNKIIVVYVPEHIQIERLMNREKIDYNSALKMIRSQMSIEEKVKYADFIINNSNSIDETKNQVAKIAKVLMNDFKH